MNTKLKRRSPKRRHSHRKDKKHKRQYRIRNWPEYNAALKQRGSLTVWFDETTPQHWYNSHKSGRRGASTHYSDDAIVCALTLQAVYHLPLRATQGLLLSLIRLLHLDISAPDYSTLSRRRKTLKVELHRQGQNQNLHLVVDSTGFKVYGEGEWKVRQHGWSKRRTWRKLHLGIDEATGEILAATGSGPERADKEVLAELLEQVDVPLDQISGDGGYDAAVCYKAITEHGDCGTRVTIVPRRNARVHKAHEKGGVWQDRNENVLRIRELQGRRRKDREWGRRQWKQESGYHRRSLAETGVMRLKTIFGGCLGARHTQSQDNELLLRCRALNQMTQLGMPQSYPL